jgi:hypothetical protein
MGRNTYLRQKYNIPDNFVICGAAMRGSYDKFPIAPGA